MKLRVVNPDPSDVRRDARSAADEQFYLLRTLVRYPDGADGDEPCGESEQERLMRELVRYPELWPPKRRVSRPTLFDAQAKERKKANGGDRKSDVTKLPPPVVDAGKARDQAGKAFGVSVLSVLLLVAAAGGLVRNVTRLAEPGGALSAAASMDARPAREVASMSAMPQTFSEAFDRVYEQNELRDGLRAAHAAHAVSGQHSAISESPADSRCHTDTDAALAGVRGHLDQYGVTTERLAKALDCRPGVIRALLETPENIPAEHREPLIRAAEAWVAADAQQREQRRSRFVQTACTRAMLTIARLTREVRCMALVTGGSGFGKSSSLPIIAAELPGETIIVRCDTDSRSAKGILRAVGFAGAAGLATSAMPSVKLGVDAARRGNGLVIFDEAHLLGSDSLEAIRAVFDEAECGVLLVGTTALRRTFTPAADPLSGPLVSRVGLRLDLDAELLGTNGRPRAWIDAATLAEILHRHDVGEIERDAAALLLRVANMDPSHLRAAVDGARVARAVARGRAGADAAITTADVETALRLAGRSESTK